MRAKFHLDPSNRLATIYQRHRQTGQRDRQIVQGEPFYKRSPKKPWLKKLYEWWGQLCALWNQFWKINVVTSVFFLENFNQIPTQLPLL